MQTEELIKYITGNCSAEESEKVRSWINEAEENKTEFIRMKNLYTLSGERIPQSDLKSEFILLNRKLKPERTRKMLVWEMMKYAAIIAVSVISTYFIIGRKGEPVNPPLACNEVIVPKGQISEYVFADGTHVWMNSGSRLRFPVNTGDSRREVILEGEAYFDVARDENRPFLVRTGSVDVKVQGTSFNVQCYPDMDKVETTLVEGSIEILNEAGKSLALLKSGEQLRFTKHDMSGKILNVDTAPYQAWRDGKLIFRDMPLGEIAASLERWYNVRIIFASEKIRNYRFSGTILKYKPFDQILQAIRLTAPIRYQIKVLPESSNEITLYAQE
jgi:ferric-dicitrate binding protein FerR (iron transport regulator)